MRNKNARRRRGVSGLRGDAMRGRSRLWEFCITCAATRRSTIQHYRAAAPKPGAASSAGPRGREQGVLRGHSLLGYALTYTEGVVRRRENAPQEGDPGGGGGAWESEDVKGMGPARR